MDIIITVQVHSFVLLKSIFSCRLAPAGNNHSDYWLY